MKNIDTVESRKADAAERIIEIISEYDLQYCEVIEPLWLREEIVKCVENNRYNKKK